MDNENKHSVYFVRLGQELGDKLQPHAKKKMLTVTSLVKMVMADWYDKQQKRSGGYKKD